METVTQESRNYYNARPSKISNIGDDVIGAKRMNFDTYETEEEKEAKKQRKAIDKNLKAIKEQFKQELFGDSPSPTILGELIFRQFEVAHGFSISQDNAREIISERRTAARANIDERNLFNKMVSAYNRASRDLANLNHSGYCSYYIKKLQKKYSARAVFIEQTGLSFDWKNFEFAGKIDNDFAYLKTKTRAVQFGNSVADNERAYILDQLAKFLKHWESSALSKQSINAVSWSFGARGKAGSVAYYLNSQKLISVNRNNIGSLAHELGHYLDYKNGLLSSKISSATVQAYRESIRDLCGNDYKTLRYYTDRKEIFARAFEAYCYKISAGFAPFAQCGDAFLPELNEELTNLVASVFA